MPVLPLVGSTIVVLPGLIRPSRSAASIMARPMRSFTLAAGFRLSSFATTSARTPPVTLLSRTSGVCPISSVMFFAIRMSVSPSTGERASLRLAPPARKKRLGQHRRIAARRQREYEADRVCAHRLRVRGLGSNPIGPARPAQREAARQPQRARDPMRREHGVLALARRAHRRQQPRAEDRAGGAELEARRALGLALRVLDEKARAAIVQEGDLAGFDGVDGQRARGEAGVEHLRLERGEEEARGPAIAAALAALEQRAGRLRVAPVAPEALRTEAVRQAAPRELGEPRRGRRHLRRRKLAHEQLEAVGAQLSGPELV